MGNSAQSKNRKVGMTASRRGVHGSNPICGAPDLKAGIRYTCTLRWRKLFLEATSAHNITGNVVNTFGETLCAEGSSLTLGRETLHNGATVAQEGVRRANSL